MFSACSHAGIINVLTHTRAVFGDEPILAVIGGFHEREKEMSERVNYHAHAVVLPRGREPIDIWVSDGCLGDEPLEGTEQLPGRFLAPGMVDAHCHLSIDFADTTLPFHSTELFLHNAERHLRSGVTALRDAGYVRQLEIAGVELPERPSVQRSGWIVAPKGRHFPGFDIQKETEPEGLESRVEEVAGSGAEWFKFIADFPGPDLDLFAAPLNYPIDEIGRATALAHRHGLRVMAHSTGKGVSALIEAGVDAIEHGMSVTPDDVRTMARRGVHWTPTIATVEHFLRGAEAMGAPTAGRENWAGLLRISLPLASSLGVPVLVGSDELAHGRIADEMLAMVRHGFGVEQTIDAATDTARKVLGLPGLEPGSPADFVLWDHDPRTDPDVLGNPVAVIAAGRRVDLETPLPAPATGIPTRERYAQAAARNTCALGMRPE